MHSFPKQGLLLSPLSDTTTSYLSAFDAFLKRNSFTGSQSHFDNDIKRYVKDGPASGYLLNSMLAVGAAYANGSNRLIALRYYSKSVISLREQMSMDETISQNSVLWTTMFLGLFEVSAITLSTGNDLVDMCQLMSDSSGHGWLQHFVHGTSKALGFSGPSAFRSGAARRFFLQARTFEVCRSIIFNDATFLAEKRWMKLSNADPRNLCYCPNTCVQEQLLDIMVKCSSLMTK